MTRTRQLTTLILIAGALLLAAGTAHAKQTAPQKCQKGRYEAAAKYASCQQKVLGKFFGGSVSDFTKFRAALSKCLVTYTATWAKLQKKASGTGSTCDNPRYDTSVADTVTDRLTGLQWEKKNNDGGVHDKDNTYTWSTGGADADGTAFTTFLAILNSGGCFAGQCDWRLPTISELQTILSQPFPCTASPCIDAVFGPTVPSFYWSSATDAYNPNYAWYVLFTYGTVTYGSKTDLNRVRAVRAGL